MNSRSLEALTDHVRECFKRQHPSLQGFSFREDLSSICSIWRAQDFEVKIYARTPLTRHIGMEQMESRKHIHLLALFAFEERK